MVHSHPQNIPFFNVIIMDYIITEQPMISSLGEIEEAVYDQYEDPREPGFYWFIRSNVKNKAEHILFGSPHTKNSQGMGGRTIPIKCTDGQVIEIQGPWWSNAEALFSATGIDVRDTVLSFVVIGRHIEYNRNGDIIRDVVYKDDEPTLGPWTRYRTIAREVFQALTNEEKLVVYHKTQGGSSYGYSRRSEFIPS